MAERIITQKSTRTPQSLPHEAESRSSPTTSLEDRKRAEGTAGSARLFDRSPHSATQRTEGIPEIQKNLENPVAPLTASETLSPKKGFWSLLKENLKVTVGSSDTPKLTRLARFTKNLFGLTTLFQTIGTKYTEYKDARKVKIATAKARRAQNTGKTATPKTAQPPQTQRVPNTDSTTELKTAETRELRNTDSTAKLKTTETQKVQQTKTTTILDIVRQKLERRQKIWETFRPLYYKETSGALLDDAFQKVEEILQQCDRGKAMDRNDRKLIASLLASVDDKLGLEPQNDLKNIDREPNYAESVNPLQQKWEQRKEEYNTLFEKLRVDKDSRWDGREWNPYNFINCRGCVVSVEEALDSCAYGGELDEEDQAWVIESIQTIDQTLKRENSDDLANLFLPTPPQD